MLMNLKSYLFIVCPSFWLLTEFWWWGKGGGKKCFKIVKDSGIVSSVPSEKRPIKATGNHYIKYSCLYLLFRSQHYNVLG